MVFCFSVFFLLKERLLLASLDQIHDTVKLSNWKSMAEIAGKIGLRHTHFHKRVKKKKLSQYTRGIASVESSTSIATAKSRSAGVGEQRNGSTGWQLGNWLLQVEKLHHLFHGRSTSVFIQST